MRCEGLKKAGSEVKRRYFIRRIVLHTGATACLFILRQWMRLSALSLSLPLTFW